MSHFNYSPQLLLEQMKSYSEELDLTSINNSRTLDDFKQDIKCAADAYVKMITEKSVLSRTVIQTLSRPLEHSRVRCVMFCTQRTDKLRLRHLPELHLSTYCSDDDVYLQVYMALLGKTLRLSNTSSSLRIA